MKNNESFAELMKSGEVPMSPRAVESGDAQGGGAGGDMLAADVGSDDGFSEQGEYRSNGASEKDIRELRRWQADARWTLDLHGEFVNEARERLEIFLSKMRAADVRMAQIIHGRGLHKTPDGRSGVLRGKVRKWLCQSPAVFAYAQPAKNDGCVNILLRKGRTR